jgi:para-aminobenzoate synthetase component 2
VQFHPESILPEGGHRMLANWLGCCGYPCDDALVRRLEAEIAATVQTARPGSAQAIASAT